MHYLNSPTHTEHTSKRELYSVIDGTHDRPSPETGQAPDKTPDSGQQPTPSTDGGSTSGTKLDLGGLTDDGGDDLPDACPSCDAAEYYDAADVLDQYGSKLSDAERDALQNHERVCSECGEVYR